MIPLTVSSLQKKFEHGGTISAEEVKVAIDYMTEQDRIVTTLVQRCRAMEKELRQLKATQ